MSALDEVIECVRLNVRSWLLDNYVGGQKRLVKWDDHRASLIQVFSYTRGLSGSTKQNLATMKKLSADGHILIKNRTSNVYAFSLPREQLDAIAAEETARWQSIGYVIGQLMPDIAAKAQPDQPSQEVEK